MTIDSVEPVTAHAKDGDVVTSRGETWSKRSGRLRDVPLEISAQIGRTRLPIRAVLELGVGQVIELDRQVGAPIDIIANNDVVIARGEVVEVDDEYGVRITEVIHGALD
ncbi:MAG: FliM/FliN family flagellar motor switch protein [Acidimicrobiales bacterium]|jgi:flagellar motor switch protein FliN/FliY